MSTTMSKHQNEHAKKNKLVEASETKFKTLCTAECLPHILPPPPDSVDTVGSDFAETVSAGARNLSRGRALQQARRTPTTSTACSEISRKLANDSGITFSFELKYRHIWRR